MALSELSPNTNLNGKPPMILCALENAQRYEACHHLLHLGFEFLRATDLCQLDEGKIDIRGAEAFAIVATNQPRGIERAKLEAHRRYIDIQVVLEGTDRIGWRTTRQCQVVHEAYDPQTDLSFFNDPPELWFELTPGNCAVFFPEDAHAPLAGEIVNRKIVVKLAVESV